MGIVEKYNKAKADYNYLVEHHGQEPNDMTGGFCEGDYYKILLEDPSKATAYKQLVSLIEYSFDAGFEDPHRSSKWDHEDSHTREIYKYYDCF